MTLDEKRGIVYAPTGSAATDFYGADRVGDDLFANSLIALDAATGKKLWHFQGVHHDIWDRDFPSPPALVTVRHEGKVIDAVAQTTKQGFLYLFDRVTGKPLFPVEERVFPKSDVPGEVTSPTQPVPVAPAPYARQKLTAEMLTTRTAEAHAWAVKQFQYLRSDGLFVPLSLDKQTVVFPGFDGGAEWGGPAVDPRSGVIYINSNDIAWTGGLAKSVSGGGVGANLYRSQCALCHGEDRKGSPPAFPSLVDVGGRLTTQQMVEVVRGGRGRMPAFPQISEQQLGAVIGYLRGGPDLVEAARGDKKEMGDDASATQAYRFTGYRKFLDPDGYPAIVPPWGTLNAIDLNTGKYLWKIPLGSYPELAAQGIANTGSENYGGPVLTASGILFLGATIYDRRIRAFDANDGRLLWQAELPFAGVATPATYMIDGRQYIVIATSGQRDRKGPQGAAYVAFALP
jgi:quinoprotein glucose dehydrogenase